MASITWDLELAQVYDETYAAMFDPAVLDPTVDLLAELADGGPAPEFAVGTATGEAGFGRRRGDRRRHDDCCRRLGLLARLRGGGAVDR